MTGAGGSIGAELSRQIAQLGPERVILIGKGENSLYDLDLELKAKYATLSRRLVVADVRDRGRIGSIMAEERPAVVFHPAAHKHVHFMEDNPEEAVKNNIVGTRVVAEAALANGVKRFVLISTDKAVNPTSVMGATKRMAELLIQALAQRDGTRLAAVRFGNVLGSRGSVVPLFKKQIARGGPVTVTHPEMTRYFMTIQEAVQLVIQAGALAEGGEIFVLDMGEPVRIVDLARNLIILSGYRPGVDVKIEFVGLRPGEKLHEELMTTAEGATATQHSNIFQARPQSLDAGAVLRTLDVLEDVAENGDREGIIRAMQKWIPSYLPEQQPGKARTTSAAEGSTAGFQASRVGPGTGPRYLQPAGCQVEGGEKKKPQGLIRWALTRLRQDRLGSRQAILELHRGGRDK